MVKNVIILLLASALAAALWARHEPSVPSVRYLEIPPSLQLPPGPPVPPKPRIKALIEAAAEKPDLAGAAIGFCLLNEEGEVIVEHQAWTAFIPASSLKTVTTATALEKWGPDLRLETRLMSGAPITKGEIQGDVVIVGGADPMLSLTDVQSWVTTLKQRGLTRITGRILGDGRLFKGSIYDDFWNWGDIGNGYGSAVCGLNLEHNRYTAVFRAAAQVGAQAEFLGARPPVPGVTWKNETVTGLADSGDGVTIHGGEGTGVVHLRGTVPLGQAEFQVLGAVPDPELFTATALRELLRGAGIEVLGRAQPVGEVKVGGVELLKHLSPPLQEIVTSIHATSDNHETECLFRLLGVRENKPADVVIREHWLARGLAFSGLRMEDGCGLARADFITPHDLAKLQFLAGSGPQGKVYQESLLSQEGLRWKGGAMSSVRSTTGFITTKAGKTLCFAYLVNHYPDSAAVNALRESLIQAMAEE